MVTTLVVVVTSVEADCFFTEVVSLSCVLEKLNTLSGARSSGVKDIFAPVVGHFSLNDLQGKDSTASRSCKLLLLSAELRTEGEPTEEDKEC